MVKIKQVNVGANYAWSPAENHPVYIAAGTAAQQLDATFSSNAKLELYAVDMTDDNYNIKCAGSIETENRFQKVVWGSGYAENPTTSGLIVCGTDKGGIEIYNPEKILENEVDCILSNSKHTGPVRSLDFNNFQKNLFASGANDSEIYIWDLKNPSNPMTPGTKTQPTSAVGALAWNKQVQHILASTSSLTSGPCCVVWDLRKNEPIIKVQDPSGRMQCSDVSWHPDVATQLVLSSEDDHLPVVQLWDLRFATSPMKVLEKHSKGVLSVSWCKQDSDLLLTCGKDNHIYCWNPNGSPPEILCELETGAQWCFDVQWCPRNPNILSTGSFDGCISIHSIMGGSPVQSNDQNQAQRNKIADAFGSDAFAGDAPQQQHTQPKKTIPLKKPPKWMRRPCAASFSFGGKLVSFENNQTTENQHQTSSHRTVKISQVVTEVELLERSADLRKALTDDTQCTAYCHRKLEKAQSEFEENFWSFLKVNFEPEPRKEFLQLLGYNPVELTAKFSKVLGTTTNGISSGIDSLSISAKSESGDDNVSNGASSSNGLDAFEQIAVAQETKKQEEEIKPMVIPVADGDIDSLISQALLIGDYEAAVDLCLHSNRMADAIVVAMAGGSKLLEKTQKRYFDASESKISRLLSAVVTKNWADVVKSCDLENWKEALASLLTYASPQDLISLCDELGERLEANPELKSHACLCYICSGNIERLVRCWSSVNSQDNNGNDIQDLIEKMMVLHRVAEQRSQGGSAASMGEASSEKLSEYAHMLASQGQLGAAMEMLPAHSDKISIQILRDRLYHSQGDTVVGYQPPVFPFSRDGSRVGHRPEAQVQPRRQMGAKGSGMYQQQQHLQHAHQPTSTSRPLQPQISAQNYQPPSVPSPHRPQVNNPYARPMQQPSYSGPQAPSNIFTPPSVAPTSQVTGMMPVQAPSAPYQPYMAPTPQTMSQSMGNPPQPPSNMYAPDMEKKHNSGGWNDPPALDPNRVPKKKKPTTVQSPPVANFLVPSQPAIPHDVYKQPTPKPIDPAQLNLMTPAAPVHNPMGNMMRPGVSPMMGGVQPSNNMMQNVPPPPPMATNYYAEERDELDHSFSDDESSAPAPSVPTGALKDTPKSPIPAEHQILQVQFDQLIKKALNQNPNQQIKRKLDDCSRRLEFLYDKLRANSLSPNIIGGLHQVAQSMESRDYANGLRHHTRIVTQSNFSEISAFMPGLKSLLQIAGQLRI
uniref:protein transport protein Sec31A isoform X3 n=1 Tax=Ciona intestinalis TaxID=7719 RepID=UPI000EF48803|nr:protein transport protein Sec31A isoform X3 [Ciona intestinalis]|eukprot:XP_026696652.1 protein transport protein Sec31A isoform X3 [Ciona intestinalis]